MRTTEESLTYVKLAVKARYSERTSVDGFWRLCSLNKNVNTISLQNGTFLRLQFRRRDHFSFK